MKAKISVFVICVKAIIYLLLHNLHDLTFNGIHEVDLDAKIQNIACLGKIMPIISNT